MDLVRKINKAWTSKPVIEEQRQFDETGKHMIGNGTFIKHKRPLRA